MRTDCFGCCSSASPRATARQRSSGQANVILHLQAMEWIRDSQKGQNSNLRASLTHRLSLKPSKAEGRGFPVTRKQKTSNFTEVLGSAAEKETYTRSLTLYLSFRWQQMRWTRCPRARVYLVSSDVKKKKGVKPEAYVLGKESTVSLQQFTLNSN